MIVGTMRLYIHHKPNKSNGALQTISKEFFDGLRKDNLLSCFINSFVIVLIIIKPLSALASVSAAKS